MVYKNLYLLKTISCQNLLNWKILVKKEAHIRYKQCRNILSTLLKKVNNFILPDFLNLRFRIWRKWWWSGYSFFFCFSLAVTSKLISQILLQLILWSLPTPTSISEPNKVQQFQFQTPGILLFTGVQKLYGP